ncbi:MAG TPA: hypothetical protein VGJ50_14630 [Streptosporangiaceae bacterium]|jgi:hypothetical protein
MTRHSPSASHRGRRIARRISQAPAIFVLLIVVAVLAGCASSATTGPPDTSPAQSPTPTASTPATARTFTSRQYGYTETPPANWYSGGQATQQWDGKGAPSDEDSVVDLFHGPGGVEAWAIAAPTKQSLAAYARTTTQAAAAEHPCPAIPQTDQAITIGGAPARLLGMQCPPGSGFLLETAVTIHDGTGFVFTSQNPTGSGDKSADRAAFRRFLAGIRFSRES